MPLIEILGKLITRIVVAALGTALAVGFVVLSAVPYGGGGKGALFASVLIALFMGAWALLPLIRWSRVFGTVFVLAWGVCAYFLSRFGHEELRGWMLGPWVLATMGIVACLFVRPPEYLSSKGLVIDDSKEEKTDA